MASQKILTGVIVEQNSSLTLTELCQATSIEEKVIILMVEHQLIIPLTGDEPDEWRFDSIALRRGRIAVSFYRDLEVNLPGVALALELLDKIEDLQQQINILKKFSDL